MKCNVAGIDRVARIVLGLVVMLAGVISGSWLGAIGLVFLGTGLASRCLVYLPFGLSTCGEPKQRTLKQG